MVSMIFAMGCAATYFPSFLCCLMVYIGPYYGVYGVSYGPPPIPIFLHCLVRISILRPVPSHSVLHLSEAHEKKSDTMLGWKLVEGIPKLWGNVRGLLCLHFFLLFSSSLLCPLLFLSFFPVLSSSSSSCSYSSSSLCPPCLSVLSSASLLSKQGRPSSKERTRKRSGGEEGNRSRKAEQGKRIRREERKRRRGDHGLRDIFVWCLLRFPSVL